MKNFRRLNVGERIEEGDIYESFGGEQRKVKASIGDIVQITDDVYRQTTTKVKKHSYPKRIQTARIIGQMIWDASGSGLSRSAFTRETTSHIVKFIQNNYRRRQKSKESSCQTR
jgi:predicted DNA-binding protein (UPF0278 family)